MTQKERLIKLILNSPFPKDVYQFSKRSAIECDIYCSDIESFAEYLLDNGVIVPPCKVGDTVFDIGGFPKIMEAEVETMTTDGQEMSSVVVNKSKPFHRWVVNWKDAGTYVFFTREAAEQALKERGE